MVISKIKKKKNLNILGKHRETLLWRILRGTFDHFWLLERPDQKNSPSAVAY